MKPLKGTWSGFFWAQWKPILQDRKKRIEDESDWGLAPCFLYSGYSQTHFTFWKVNNRERICKVKIKVTSSHFSAQKKEQNVCVICRFQVMSYWLFTCWSFQFVVNSRGCNKTRDTCELHLHFWFLLDCFSYTYVSFQEQRQIFTVPIKWQAVYQDQRNKSRKECMLGGRDFSNT